MSEDGYKLVTPNDYVACICEGSSELTIINLLLEKECLIFSEDNLLNKSIMPPKYFRNSAKFSSQYLTMDYHSGRLFVFLIQDRKGITYRIKKPYSDKIEGPYYFVTAPEIEMLMIHSLNAYNDYKKKSNISPSEYLCNRLKIKEASLKSHDFIKDFYGEHDLKAAIITHKSKSKKTKGNLFLADLLA